jgi:hypothetical protein
MEFAGRKAGEAFCTRRPGVRGRQPPIRGAGTDAEGQAPIVMREPRTKCESGAGLIFVNRSATSGGTMR